MKFNIISIFPEMFKALTESGVVGQAVKKKLVEIFTLSPREFTEDFHKTVDDRPFGGGDGMVMLAEPLQKSFESLREKDQLGHVIYLTPQGAPLTAKRVEELSEMDVSVTLLCGRYSGVDERILARYVDEEISIGDFVVSGGELPAMMLIDAVTRHVPGVLGHEDSAKKDSFHSGLLEAPQFTRPREALGMPVPDEFLSGDHKKIDELRLKLSLVRTAIRRPDLIKEEDKKSLQNFAEELGTWDEILLSSCGLKKSELENLNV